MFRRPHHRSFRVRRQPRSFNPSWFIQKTKSQSKLDVVAIKNDFADFPVSNQVKANAKAKGYLIPTPIQDQVIPLVSSGKDVVGVANTGTGKTAAFLIPLIDKAAKNRREKVLVITPTRELAAQIEAEFIELAASLNLYSALCIGGAGINRQISRLRQKPPFVIGTPGRLKDLVKRRILDLTGFTTIVLDEVDRMLDMGFINDVKQLISLLPKVRQSLFFSATVEGKVRQLMAGFLRNPVIISVKRGDIADNVDQEVVKVSGRNKIDVLCELLTKPGFDRVLVFGRTKWGMEKLAQALIQKGLKATAIHGNKSQNQRQRALAQFKTGGVKVLLATDVAQRGLDIEGVTHVINFDLPETEDDYIHRIGRTARADKKGVAISLVP
ncbi:MAG: DEAD/DEAH box helicase domain protein [Candidatus Beckwithbacteria bacterium GW2011_GWB1_47_15]|uniref:DEAD/DEAH box helicase domain protein n=1 Tax=Candidatus Beckwithbacteria bacterium GW2011_GWB1_47_15 TaxID=1618371 RepID=A0A0G1UST5_9BACT|nr:MAG: putative DEAD/DEAH box helicase domain protein [Candidatus Beckwithbacteria bacterium GW2011_GWC1_49_16]KKU35156.1 MAG: DEAD/DEAH box helicase domain protein [Candidatus Beckwithbacteria bacterium GW2011_GWA1_46_30]KKU60800.1 MAG: DEAD/DEAH box helicase domain protein [Candidatus Beckwithbacteria bacterium GW2011_GWB1_47_15]KKU71605.1 MAG: DEAD/DEAH box helicase domain protein [Candidatus Beckwithbacteria bacterium GW2011_GWA2_47_25]KKW03442.1 MAG: DEAD/DEAH box helicase domain protein 